MTKTFCLLFLSMLVISSCQKEITAIPIPETTSAPLPSNGFTKYTIRKGEQYCDKNGFRPVEISEMKFMVRFDSSAVYQTLDPANQYDINKLYGFSDNNGPHHLFSARIGWRWSDGALRLFGYIYNNGMVESKELTTVPIGTDIACSIKVTTSSYTFNVNNTVNTLPRLSLTPLAKGYQLYPYFGGDEFAPHEINILIKEL